jgi:uncharacterized repeat protein (TIGR04076 family)
MDLTLDLETFTVRCRYHKYPRRDRFPYTKIPPEGMCMDLFHTSYPFSLALIYNAALAQGRKYTFSCPSAEASVTARVSVRNDSTYYLKRVATFILRKLGNPTEIPDQACEYEITSVSGKCPHNHRPRQKFSFNMWTHYTICPAAMDNMYPVLHNLSRGAAIPWQGSEDYPNAPLRCPDPNGSLTFSVSGGKDSHGEK